MLLAQTDSSAQHTQRCGASTRAKQFCHFQILNYRVLDFGSNGYSNALQATLKRCHIHDLYASFCTPWTHKTIKSSVF